MNLITGSSGFIGGRLYKSLTADGSIVRRLVRSVGGNNRFVAQLADRESLAQACNGVDTIFHCAGYAHAFSSRSSDDAATHWKVNFEGTCNLIQAAADAGVRRFVFLSSIKAMAEPGEMCVNEDFPGDPDTDYGQSKMAAENVVLEVGRRNGMHVVNLRLAMVYGSGGRGNLERMGNLVKRRIFPPLPETGNHRSLVHVDDVVSAMRLVASDDRANGQTYIVASREAPSGRRLFDALRQAQGLPPCKWSVPAFVLHLSARLGDGVEKLVGRRLPLDSEVVDRLLRSAWYSPARIERELGWQARVSLMNGLSEMLDR